MSNYKKLASVFAGLAFLLTSMALPVAAQTAPNCSEDSFALYSGTNTLADGDAAVATYVHPLWTASIPGATWIWDAAQVANPQATTTVSFTQNFTVNDDLNSAVLHIAADNAYAVYVNGDLVATSSAITYNNAAAIDLSAYVDQGANTLRIDVTNYAGTAEDTALTNPAGLLYSLNVNAGSCNGVETGKAWINVVKTVTGNVASSSAFTINVNANGVSTTTATSSLNALSILGNASGTLLTVAPGAYNVTEQAATGYNATYSSNCSGTILAGQTLTCTITNTAVAPVPTMGHLTVIKHVINDDNGDNSADDFTLTVHGNGVSTSTSTSSAATVNIAGNTSGTLVYMLPGSYSVVEGSHSGYDVSYSSSCSGTIAAGESRTCIVTNNDIQSGSTSGNVPTNNNVNNNNIDVNVNPDINVHPVFYNIAGTGSLLSATDWQDFLDRVNRGDVLGAATTELSCGPTQRAVLPGQLLKFTATGGSGNYVWTAPQMAARSGNELTVYYPVAGTSSVTVTSGGVSKTCYVTIAGQTSGGTSGTPGLPNTGMGGNATLLLNMGVVLALSGITTMILRKRAAR